MIEIITPPQAATPRAPYSFATKANGFIFVAGVVSLGRDGQLVGENDAGKQTAQILDLIKAALEIGGSGLDCVMHNQIFLRDLADYVRMNEVYRAYFSMHLPARFVVRAELVRPDFLVEISSTALVRPA
jgi:aminoacrylate peracid reductase